MKITEYLIVEHADPEGVEKAVYSLIKEGWQPFGSLSITEIEYAQAMVKYEDHTERESIHKQQALME